MKIEQVRIVTLADGGNWSLAYGVGWTDHENHRPRTYRHYDRHYTGQELEDWLAGWDARHRATIAAMQEHPIAP